MRQCQEKTGTVALLGAVSAHWRGAGVLAGSLVGWKTAPGALWRWERRGQPGLWVAYPSAGLLPGWLLCLAPCSPGNASVPSVCLRRKSRKKFVFTVSKSPRLVPRESRALGAYVCIVPGFVMTGVAPYFCSSLRFPPVELRFSCGIRFVQRDQM